MKASPTGRRRWAPCKVCNQTGPSQKHTASCFCCYHRQKRMILSVSSVWKADEFVHRMAKVAMVYFHQERRTFHICVLQISFPRHTISKRHHRKLPPNAAIIKEQDDDHYGSELSRRARYTKRTFLSTHRGRTYTPPSVAATARYMFLICMLQSSIP